MIKKKMLLILNHPYFHIGLSSFILLIMLLLTIRIFNKILSIPSNPEPLFVSYEFDRSLQAEEGEGSASLLPETPHPDLIEKHYKGLLPKIAPNGLTPFQYYAQSFDSDSYPKSIALAIGPFDLSIKEIYPLIDRLPERISVILSPYTDSLNAVITYARERGHEVFLSLPLEPFDSQLNDQGPNTLLVHRTPKANQDHLNILLAKASGYVGFVNLYGERFVARENQMRPLLQAFKKRGLAFIDASQNLRSLTRSLSDQLKILQSLRLKPGDQIDDALNPKQMEEKLLSCQSIAQRGGKCLLLLNAYPATIDLLVSWQKNLPKDLTIAPISSSFLPKVLTLKKPVQLDEEPQGEKAHG